MSNEWKLTSGVFKTNLEESIFTKINSPKNGVFWVDQRYAKQVMKPNGKKGEVTLVFNENETESGWSVIRPMLYIPPSYNNLSRKRMWPYYGKALVHRYFVEGTNKVKIGQFIVAYNYGNLDFSPSIHMIDDEPNKYKFNNMYVVDYSSFFYGGLPPKDYQAFIFTGTFDKFKLMFQFYSEFLMNDQSTYISILRGIHSGFIYDERKLSGSDVKTFITKTINGGQFRNKNINTSSKKYIISYSDVNRNDFSHHMFI